MICLGLTDTEKAARVGAYCREHSITRVVVLSPSKFRLALPPEVPHEHVEWAEIIMYKFFYRLLQEIGKDTLVVVNECLRTQNRYELTYNCIRLFLNQTPHRLIFQYLPLIDTLQDFATLFDFDTGSRWKREPFRPELLRECSLEVRPVPLDLTALPVETDAKTRSAYAKEKRKLIDGIGLKDPHTIPRNLYLMSGRARLAHVREGEWYVGRNNRFGVPTLQTYREPAYPHRYTVFEFCHNFIDFADWLALSRQVEVPALVADLKVDRWYFQRYTDWATRIRDAYAVLRQ